MTIKEEFDEIWRKIVHVNIKELEALWNIHAGEWFNEISGDVVGSVDGVPYSDYMEFDALSGEEQYAFSCWLARRGIWKLE